MCLLLNMNIIIVVEYNYFRLKLNKYISYVFIVESYRTAVWKTRRRRKQEAKPLPEVGRKSAK